MFREFKTLELTTFCIEFKKNSESQTGAGNLKIFKILKLQNFVNIKN